MHNCLAVFTKAPLHLKRFTQINTLYYYYYCFYISISNEFKVDKDMWKQHKV